MNLNLCNFFKIKENVCLLGYSFLFRIVFEIKIKCKYMILCRFVDRGYSVVGVEISEFGIREFFIE